jgi:chorismate mutase-like protein
MTIDELRQRIDHLDERLVELLNERATCALEIGEVKRAQGVEVYQPDREADVLRHVQACGRRADGPLGPEAIGRVFERIIDEARRIERGLGHGGGSVGVGGGDAAGE